MPMSPRMKAKKGRFGAGGFPPTVTILTPSTGVDVFRNVAFPATGTAVDSESGDLTSVIDWSTVADGSVGTGGSPSITLLTLGAAQVLTAGASDGTNLGTSTISVNVLDETPVVAITSPSDPAVASSGVGFAAVGTATDPVTSNDIASGLTWTSDVDGVVGTGANPTITLTTTGAHVITADVSANGANGTAILNVTVS